MPPVYELWKDCREILELVYLRGRCRFGPDRAADLVLRDFHQLMERRRARARRQRKEIIWNTVVTAFYFAYRDFVEGPSRGNREVLRKQIREIVAAFSPEKARGRKNIDRFIPTLEEIENLSGAKQAALEQASCLLSPHGQPDAEIRALYYRSAKRLPAWSNNFSIRQKAICETLVNAFGIERSRIPDFGPAPDESSKLRALDDLEEEMLDGASRLTTINQVTLLGSQ